MLGKLVKGLRMLGYDTLYWRGDSQAILKLASRDGRIVLTRKRSLLKARDGLKVVLVCSDNPREQLLEIVRECDLSLDGAHLKSRCLCCNGLLLPVQKEVVVEGVPDYIYQTHKAFSSCSQCGKIYWKGTHLHNMDKRIQGLREEKVKFTPHNQKDPL